MDRTYCTVDQVVGWGTEKEATLMDYVRAASDWISQNIGDFIPVTATKRFDGSGDIDLWVPPLLAITTITDDGDSLASTDYLLYPRNKWWENGPYTRLRVDPDAANLSAWTAEEDTEVITGRWGMYEESRGTGATVQNTTQISASGTELLVNNGSLVRPGHVLLVESEQLLIEATAATLTDSTADTSEAVDVSEDAIDVTDGTKVFVGEVVRIDNEQMLVLEINTNTVIVERGFNRTAKAAHSTSVSVYAYRSYTVKRGVNGTTAAAHANATAISKYVMPWDINYLCLQMASLMSKKKQGGFAGKVGNAELGEVFYNNEFPKTVLDDIKHKYLQARRHGA